MSKKIALITGVTGQDGSYLAEFLLDKGYIVHGIKRRSSQFNTQRVDHIYQDSHQKDKKFYLHYGDLTDPLNLFRLISEIMPDEIYNLGAQSHVAVSFDSPEYTSNVDGLGALRILETIRSLKNIKDIKFYQASTSELFGDVFESPQSEKTPFNPMSPYAVAKLYAYYITVNYRNAYNIFACNGILFNHESPRRGETFVTRKITMGLSNVLTGNQDCIYLGNIYAKRDWGHAKDFVEMQWLMLQQDEPDDFCIATGIQFSVRDFVNFAWNHLGKDIRWEGKGADEKGYDVETGDLIVSVDARYFRPTEVETLLGDPSKAKEKLGWEPKVTLEEMVHEMMENDINIAKRDFLAIENGFKAPNYNE